MRLGLFGGTFDPIHNAHLFVAEAARVDLELERVIFLPTRGAHYRRPPIADVATRLDMLRLAIASNVHFALDDSDVDEVATGYTADLLPRLRRRYPDAHFTFIVGGDALIDWPWQRFDAVLAGLDAFAVAPRAQRAPQQLTGFLEGLSADGRAKFRLLDLPALSVSATLVRDALSCGSSIRYLVPEPVYRYIREHAVYAEPPRATMPDAEAGGASPHHAPDERLGIRR